MKQKFKFLLSIALIAPLFFVSCDNDEKEATPANDLVVDNTSVTLLQNDEIVVTITSGNGGYSVKAVDASVAGATVSGDKVTIKAPEDAELGETTILVLDERKKVARIKVRVARLWDLTVDKSEHEMFIGAMIPVKIETGNGNYEISIEEGEDIIELGPLTGQVFTVKALKQGGAKVKIKDKKDKEIIIDILVKIVDLELDKYEVSLIGPSKTTDVNILAGNGGYVMTYSPDGIVIASEVNNVITITSQAVGTTVVTVTDQLGSTKDIEVTVLPKEIATDVETLTVYGTKANNKFGITDGNGGYSVVSGNEDVATVAISGSEVTVTAKKTGSTSVTITDAHGKTKDVEISVVPMAMNMGYDYCLIANYGALANSNDYKALPQVTFEVRFKLNGIRGLQGFIGLEGNLLLRGNHDDHQGDQNVELVSKLGGDEQKMITQKLLKTNVWYHLALVFDGSQPNPEDRHKLYVNGELYTNFLSTDNKITIDKTAVDLTKTNNAPGLGIGRIGHGDYRAMNGIVAEARVWKTARTADQIRDNICLFSETDQSGLISRWVCGYGIQTPSITDLNGVCDAVVYDNKSNNVENAKTFPADKWAAAGCP
ncbi:LamG-like jellyroll fold domain-containing protein [Dysgonomonas sp. 511]|uniref:LamG-like jellyroll fold domain-containing protein n=1 Tax=Dysgonomonas sp. 511 TaxID=2302930 RepID=UPI0013D89803|nr:LamG-like jellyroll fold domain-containing protein [Dysgonomonas sp. 511]NDV77990.1 hypothetical protein [Dysgonomonas sp. 511]